MKTFTLFKRDATGKQIPADQLAQHRERPYHFKFEFRGKPYVRCLETTDAAEAQRRARLKFTEITQAVIAGEYERLDATKTRHTVHATLGELLAAYRTSPVKANPTTRESNIRALLNILTQLNGGASVPASREQLLQTPFPKLVNGDTAEAWFKLAGIEPQTANSLWRQAASLCAPRALFTYRKLKMFHPCLEEFASTGTVCQRPVSKTPPRPPSDDIIAATLKAWEQLGNDDAARNLFLAIGHELAFGLRAGEVSQARWNWWTIKYGAPMLCATGQFKHNHEGYFEQPALDPFFSIMRNKAIARGWLLLGRASVPASQDDYIITGSDSYRADGIEREVSAFLRQLGWETTKTNHALRAYAGGQVALKYGIYKAKEFLRHSSVKVTEQHYMYLLKHPLLDTIRDASPVKWATAEPIAPILTIVERTA